MKKSKSQRSHKSTRHPELFGRSGNTRKAGKGKATETLFCSSHDSDKKKLTDSRKKITLLQRNLEDTLSTKCSK